VQRYFAFASTMQSARDSMFRRDFWKSSLYDGYL
jgi:hypothetical protein